ncbi:hypothetical protein [Pandoraea commovens]|uniref:Uncharacterized protein n=1 Tax=Pandoraea commovens TaxID=2508289 RepID=A0A5E4XCE4_9BURK|nr:hypothetical protein [Pandoraea commovens]VVE33820.1 hypothetical protein PCO31010_03810 [Pandoraea commovens]
MFELEAQQAKLTSVNPRAELHGEDKKPAVDLKFEVAADNGVLANFAADLRGVLYTRPDAQDDLVDPDRLSKLKYPKMSPFKWELEGVGYTAEIDYGLGGDSNIVLEELKVDGFRIQPMEGGTVIVSFRCIAHPEEDDMGKLCGLIQRDVTLTLTAPPPTSVHDLLRDA